MIWLLVVAAIWVACHYTIIGRMNRYCDPWTSEETSMAIFMFFVTPAALLMTWRAWGWSDCGGINWQWPWKWDSQPQPASSQNGQLDVTTLRKAVAALKAAAPM